MTILIHMRTNRSINLTSVSLLILAIATITLTAQNINQGNAIERSNITVHSTHSSIDLTPVAAIIFINQDKDNNIVFVPSNVSISAGEEVLILNNSTSEQSITNGLSPDDKFSGKFFDTGLIKPNGFVEYASHNISPGEYPFYSKASPESTGKIIVN